MTQLDLVQQAASNARAARIGYIKATVAHLLENAAEAAQAADIPDLDISVAVHLRNLAKHIRTETAAITSQMNRQ